MPLPTLTGPLNPSIYRTTSDAILGNMKLEGNHRNLPSHSMSKATTDFFVGAAWQSALTRRHG